ncbi:TPA: hypothetical protein H1005_03025, partial [archaeon]|nr:hypothetical protein [Candidatus Naiadarchaeales archaeon SRR2090153.bin1042]
VSAGENGTFSIMPGKQLSSPKVTIVTGGVTETIYPVERVNYELKLPSDASVQTLTSGCSLSGGQISCQNLNQTVFNALEIRWSKPAGGSGLFGKIRQNIGNLLPGLTNVFKGIGSSLAKLVKGK